MQQVIMSVQNERVKRWSSLRGKKGRQQHGMFLLEGVHLVGEALRAGVRLEAVIYPLSRGLPDECNDLISNEILFGVSDEVFDKCVDTESPQAIVAVAPISKRSVEQDWSLLTGAGQQSALVVLIDAVQDPGNLGTMIRSAAAAGASAVVLGAGSADLYQPKTVRATMGALFYLPVFHAELVQLTRNAKADGIKLYVSKPDARTVLYDADLRGNVWLAVGNEGSGVSQSLVNLADAELAIPMSASAESLNVAMATTVMLFEASRQRRATF